MLEQLGFNWTFFVQFAMFIFSITFLSLYVFKPYTDAAQSREKQTKGSEDLAADLEKQSTELYAQYEQQARKVNSSIQDIYKTARQLASEENEKTIALARKEAAKLIEENRAKIKLSVQKAEDGLKTDVPQIVIALTQKLLGKS
jgi:F0F1-type ATP synthase membrane subunit b/b'